MQRGLTLILADRAKLRLALELALVQVALGGRARLFASGASVAALRDDERALRDEALGAGVVLSVCQTGLAEIGGNAADFDARISFAGLVSLIATLGDDRLVTL